MAIAYFHEWPGATPEMAQAVSDRVSAQTGGAPPEGGLFHAEGQSDSGWWSFDVWESEDAARRFYDELVGPAAAAMGAPQGQMRTLPVHWHSMEAPAAAR